jgi:hypothetical protein
MDDLTVIFEEQRIHVQGGPAGCWRSVSESDDLLTDPAGQAKHADRRWGARWWSCSPQGLM